jgi:hypothetical protein
MLVATSAHDKGKTRARQREKPKSSPRLHMSPLPRIMSGEGPRSREERLALFALEGLL